MEPTRSLEQLSDGELLLRRERQESSHRRHFPSRGRSSKTRATPVGKESAEVRCVKVEQGKSADLLAMMPT
jgi:hypothetical protein